MKRNDTIVRRLPRIEADTVSDLHRAVKARQIDGRYDERRHLMTVDERRSCDDRWNRLVNERGAAATPGQMISGGAVVRRIMWAAGCRFAASALAATRTTTIRQSGSTLFSVADSLVVTIRTDAARRDRQRIQKDQGHHRRKNGRSQTTANRSALECAEHTPPDTRAQFDDSGLVIYLS